jgi:MoaA/NifB/PqqE/SkfB family radical SAM enzyme
MGILYTNTKIFHYPDKIKSLPGETDQMLPPLHIRLKPTNVCNHNCWYCAYRQADFQLGKDMVVKDFIPQGKMMEIISDCAEMGVKAITFTGGGEPLVYPHILETVKVLADSDIKFATLTNGSKLNGEIAEIFAHRGTWVRVSLDGWDGPSYAFHRKVSVNEFSKVMNNLENFKTIGGTCYLSVVCIINKENHSHVYDMIKNLSNIGIDSVKASPAIISNCGNENNEYHKPYMEMVGEQVSKAIKDFQNDKFEISNGYYEQLTTFNKNYAWCPNAQITPVIGADLNVYSCQDKAYNIEEGMIFSIKNQRFKDGWFSDKSNYFRINPKIHCNHHCVANAKNKIIMEYLDADLKHLEFV